MVLITLDFGEITKSQRELLFKLLESNSWRRIPSLPASFVIPFDETYVREEIENILEDDIKNAKLKSKVDKVNYAYQMSKVRVTIGYL